MIRVACPHCERSFRTQTEAMGRTAVCTGCHQSFRIGDKRLPFDWNQTDAGMDSWIGVAAPVEKQELKDCIICSAPMQHDQIVCPECGANQVTGLKRPASPATDSQQPRWFEKLPLTWIFTAIGLLIVGAVIYQGITWIKRSAEDSGTQAALLAQARRAAQHLNSNADLTSFRNQFSGIVTDENLPTFMKMLDANNPSIREAATQLIGCGSFTNVTPILEYQPDDPEGIDADTLLEAIGPRRLIRLSNSDDPDVRQKSARALCRLSQFQCDQQMLVSLAEPMTDQAKIDALNNMGRAWPEATGTFTVNATDNPLGNVEIEQIGQTFYLHIGQTSFRSGPGQVMLFEIPIENWCRATGSAVDIEALRSMLSGKVILASLRGGAWEGQMILHARQTMEPPHPGWIPTDHLQAGDTVEVPLTLTKAY